MVYERKKGRGLFQAGRDKPIGYVVKGQEDKVLKLKKALYGLKQAPRVWNSRIDKYLEENSYRKCPYEHAFYIKTKGQDVMIICLLLMI